MTKHTPGPWHSDCGCIYAECQMNERGTTSQRPLAEVTSNQDHDDHYVENCLLIAAAPDLLSCLVEMVEVHDEPCRLDHHGCCQSHFLDDVNDGGCRVANARAAIFKATGEQL